MESRAFLRLGTGHGGLHPRPARCLLHRPRRQPAVATAPCARRPGTTPATCSSARRCRSTLPATARPRRSGASPASAARRTWGPTRAAAGTPARRGSRPAARPAPAATLIPRGQKLVVQMVETFREHMQPAFVERLDAWELAESAGMALPPVMIYGDDVTPHPDRGRHRQPAAVPHRRGARAGDPRRRRLHRRSGSGATSAWSRTCATAA